MAKDDYDVIVCKVLVFFYRRLKGKIPDDEAASYLNPVTKQLPVSEDYLNAVIMDLIDLGFIADAEVNRAWGGDIMNIDTRRARITLKGVEYLRDNSKMRKIAEVIKEAESIWSLFC